MENSGRRAEAVNRESKTDLIYYNRGKAFDSVQILTIKSTGAKQKLSWIK